MNGVFYFLTAIVVNTTLKIWITSEAGNRLGQDRKLGALELLVSTPLSIADILRGQMLALRRQFLGLVLVVLGLELVCCLSAERHADADEVAVSVGFGLASHDHVGAGCAGA